MKFEVGDIIRHVNGVKSYSVVLRNTKVEFYALEDNETSEVHFYGASYVDRMYKYVSESSKDDQTEQPEPEVITEYEIYCWGALMWTDTPSYSYSDEDGVRYTGRTRKVVVW